MEWKRQPDSAWLTRTNLIKYWMRLDDIIDIPRCQQFFTSMAERSEDEPYPSGVVNGVLVQYSCRYLHAFFGWDGIGVTEWNSKCANPRPNIAVHITDLQPKADGRYDVFSVGSVLKELWFVRMRGVLSKIFFKNGCNSIQPEHLGLFLMADQGEKINWGLILDDLFCIQLRRHRQKADCQSPIGPFLTTYIACFLSYHRQNNKPPLMGTFSDI